MSGVHRHVLRVADLDLGATLGCGQAFRWVRLGDVWEGVAAGRWARLASMPDRSGIVAETAGPETEWLRAYLGIEEDYPAILASFPDDPPMRAAVAACRGLRLLRQEPWECLASFICSSTKRIVQIRQIVADLCGVFGEPVAAPGSATGWRGFPEARRIVEAGEAALRGCRLGFRAPYLIDAARRVADGRLDLAGIARLPTGEAREHLLDVHGVGRKIADCVLLFAYGRQDAFPIDVWVRRALRELYFPRARRTTAGRLERFAATYFGPWAGYAQQYLFHHARLRSGRAD